MLLAVTVTCGYGQEAYAEWVEKSYEELDKGNLVEAETCLREAMSREPGNPMNYALLGNLGTIQRRQGKPEEALTSYSAALSRRPDDVLLLENRATLYMELGETDKAIADYSMLLMEQPEHQNGLYARGLLYLKKEDWIKAENDFEKLLEMNRESYYGALGHAILEKMRGNYDVSEQLYNFLIGRMPKDLALYEGRADLYFRMGNNSRALADINKIFYESRPTAEQYVLRGKINLARSDKKAALEDFRNALQLGYDPQVIRELQEMAK